MDGNKLIIGYTGGEILLLDADTMATQECGPVEDAVPIQSLCWNPKWAPNLFAACTLKVILKNGNFSSPFFVF